MFEGLKGNERIKGYLTRAIQEERLPHTLLFAGIEGIGKGLFARRLAAALLKTPFERLASHPDFHLIRPESKSGLHSIENLRELIDEVHTTPFEAERKFFLIEEADRMQPAAANALLKTLEEPQLDTTLVLLSSRSYEILPTILSRCVRLSFQPLTQEERSQVIAEKGAHPKGGIEELLFPLFVPENRLLRTSLLEKVEAWVEDDDPVQKNRNLEALFATLLMWARDQVARPLGVALFFPNAPAKTGLSLEPFQKRLEEVRVAVQRNMKLAACLERLL